MFYNLLIVCFGFLLVFAIFAALNHKIYAYDIFTDRTVYVGRPHS